MADVVLKRHCKLLSFFYNYMYINNGVKYSHNNNDNSNNKADVSLYVAHERLRLKDYAQRVHQYTAQFRYEL